MKPDKPFLKGLVYGFFLFVFAAIFLHVLVSRENEDSHYIRYGRILLAAYVPAMLVSVWAFFSKRQWSWSRFAITATGVCILCLIGSMILMSSFGNDNNSGNSVSPPLFSNWKRFSPPSGEFSVFLPRAPNERETSMESRYGKVTFHLFIAEIKPLDAYGVGFSDLPTGMDLHNPEWLFDNTTKEFLKNGYKIDSQQERTFKGYSGMEFRLSKDDYKIIDDVFLVDHRLYQLISMIPQGSFDSNELQLFISSFAVTTSKRQK